MGILIRILLLAAAACAQEGPVPFRKAQPNSQFYSEGVHHADLDKDGSQDLIAGPYWYPGPDWARKLSFRAPKAAPFDTAGDSDCYGIFPYDFNGDGWIDILSMRVAGGSEAVWYENPKAPAANGNWTAHIAHSLIENESATLMDMDGDGKPELISNSAGYGGYATPDWADPGARWAFKRVTAKGTWGAFTHGIGAGDLNGDGRKDLIFPTGWWEQPAQPTDTPWTAHPAAFWGQAAPQEGPGGAQMHAYDVDGDGDNDVVTSLQAHGYGLAWFENKDKGRTFTQHMIMNLPAEKAQYGAAFSQMHALALGDLDGDGLTDLVTGKRKGAHGKGVADVDSPAVLYWFRLTRPAGAPPKFIPYRIDAQAGIGTQLIVADVSGDGAPDILTARRSGVFAFINQRPGSRLINWPGRTRRLPANTSWQTNAFATPLFRGFGVWDGLGRLIPSVKPAPPSHP